MFIFAEQLTFDLDQNKIQNNFLNTYNMKKETISFFINNFQLIDNQLNIHYIRTNPYILLAIFSILYFIISYWITIENNLIDILSHILLFFILIILLIFIYKIPMISVGLFQLKYIDFALCVKYLSTLNNQNVNIILQKPFIKQINNLFHLKYLNTCNTIYNLSSVYLEYYNKNVNKWNIISYDIIALSIIFSLHILILFVHTYNRDIFSISFIYRLNTIATLLFILLILKKYGVRTTILESLKII